MAHWVGFSILLLTVACLVSYIIAVLNVSTLAIATIVLEGM